MDPVSRRFALVGWEGRWARACFPREMSGWGAELAAWDSGVLAPGSAGQSFSAGLDAYGALVSSWS